MSKTQATWYINPGGNDTWSGAAPSTPIKTQAEWVRRTEGRPEVAMTLNFTGTTAMTEAMIWDVTNSFANSVTVKGVRSASIFSGTFSAIQHWNPATGTDGRFTATAIPVSWTASNLVGKFGVITSGAAIGRTFWIVKDLGSKVARFSWVSDAENFDASVVPSNGDTFTLHNHTNFSGAQLIMNRGHQSALFFKDIEFGTSAGGSHQHRVTEGAPFFINCKTHGLDAQGTGMPQMLGCYVSNGSATRVYENAALTAFACVFPSGVTVHRGYLIPEACISQGPILLEGPGSNLQLSGSLGIFDTTNPLTMGTFSEADLSASKLWGTGVSGVGVTMGSACRVVYGSANPISITAPTTQMSIAGANKLYSNMPYVDAVSGSMVVVKT